MVQDRRPVDMNETVFINGFISFGMSDYFAKEKGNTFESHIIECLCDIYGKDRIRYVYESENEGAFINLLHSYGLSRNMYDNFIRDTYRFLKFKEENRKDPSIKSDIASKIEVSLITMFLYKCLLFEPTLEELSHFENDLLNNFEMIKFHFNTSLYPNKTREIWDKKKKILSDNVELVEIKPNYLDEITYARFGTSLDDVKKMDYRMVEELNSYIKDKMNAMTIEEGIIKPERKKFSFTKTSLSTGSGFADAILIASIIATEMSIGLIYLFLHM